MPLKIESLQTQISKKGHDWTADETSVSNLSAQEQKGLLGLIVDEAELNATEKAVKAAESLSAFRAESLALPTSVDWRNNGGNFTTPIKDQGGCGSCVSFGTLATIESKVKIACKNPGINPDYSEAFLFYCGCGNCCGTGWFFPPALNFCKNTGVANEASFPYTAGNQPCKSGVPVEFKINAWTTALSMADRKNVLANKGPVVGGFQVYQDFYNYTGGVYRHTTGNLVGGHAISVVGYDDAQQCWICKNSWGTGWGESFGGSKGWFRIGYGECNIDTGFAFYDVSVNCPPIPQPTPNCIQYVPLLRQVLVAAQTNPLLRRCLRYHVCGKPSIPPICPASYMAIVTSVNKILKLCPQYRKPFCDIIG